MTEPNDPSAAAVIESAPTSLNKNSWRSWLLPLLLILVGSGIRFYDASGPLIGIHCFRQTQTAYAARVFQKEGISLMHSPLPMFGPPNDVPFEMPLFQAGAAILSNTTGMNLDDAVRMTHTICFLASAGMLYLLASLLFGRGAGIFSVILYLWSPLTIYWSRAGLMEFLAVFFALAYAYVLILFIHNPGKKWLPLLAIIAGCGGTLVKITTMATVAPVITISYAIYWFSHANRKEWKKELVASGLFHGAFFASLFIPVLVGQWWVWHADAIKAASPLTLWLTSANLSAWNYGTLEQRITPENWRIIFSRTGEIAAPFAILAFAVVPFLTPTSSRQQKWIALGIFAGVLFPILVFFNLYMIHDYYQCATTPMVALLCGTGLYFAWQIVPKWQGRTVMGLLLLFSTFLGWGYAQQSYIHKPENDLFYAVGKAVAEVTPPNERIVVKDDDWNPSIQYYSDREGISWYIPPDTQSGRYNINDMQNMVRKMDVFRITTIVCKSDEPMLFSLWKSAKPVKQIGPFFIVKVSDPK